MNNKKLNSKIIIMTITSIVILAIGYISLRLISEKVYSSNDKNETKFKNIIVDENFVINRYFNQIAEIIKISDISALQSLIDSNDNKYYIMGSRGISKAIGK